MMAQMNKPKRLKRGLEANQGGDIPDQLIQPAMLRGDSPVGRFVHAREHGIRRHYRHGHGPIGGLVVEEDDGEEVGGEGGGEEDEGGPGDGVVGQLVVRGHGHLHEGEKKGRRRKRGVV